MVLGAGVSGVCAAWYLANAGFKVSVLDRQSAAGQETSYANGGQISVSHPEPWSSPSTPLNVLRWLGRRDAPLRLHWRADSAQWRWSFAFLRECLPSRYHRNLAAIATLAVYSLDCLRQVREQCGLSYQQQTRGILHLCHHENEWRAAARKREQLTRYGIDGELCSPARCVEIDPALNHLATRLEGGFYAPGDESGNARLFTEALAAQAAAMGAAFFYDTRIAGLKRHGDKIAGVEVIRGDGVSNVLAADAYVLCLGSYSPLLMAPLGVRLPIYPLKGYSVTIPVKQAERVATIALTDESRRIVSSRLGQDLRVAGTAELAGYDTSIDPRRCDSLVRWADEAFPGALDLAGTRTWAGLRPSTPGNVPLIGRSSFANLWYNTGHGSLGWTLACGSASCLSQWMSGKRPPVTGFPFLG